jgi:hypothetical protein
LLILKRKKFCIFCGHSDKTLDLQGFDLNQKRISTKLSTEFVNFRKIVPDQALSQAFSSSPRPTFPPLALT